MKKPITKWVIVAILILLIAYSGFATYNWLEGERRIEDPMANYTIHFSSIPLWELSDMGSVAEYLIKPDTTDELLRERITQYFFHARALFNSSKVLHALTSDGKYWLLGIAMHNLQGFFSGMNNKPNGKEILTANLDVLKQMDNALDGIPTIGNLTLADAEKLLQLSGNLTVS